MGRDRDDLELRIFATPGTAGALRELGKEVELHVIDAPYGHDCFLLEEARQTPMIQGFLGRENKKTGG